MGSHHSQNSSSLPDRARLGLRSLEILKRLQTLERCSVDVLVARAIAAFHTTHPRHKELEQQQAGDTNGQEKGTVKH